MINLFEINLSQLMSNNHFIISCTLLKNEIDIIIKFLANFKANEFAFLNTSFVINLSKFLNIYIKKLLTSIQVKEYNEKSFS